MLNRKRIYSFFGLYFLTFFGLCNWLSVSWIWFWFGVLALLGLLAWASFDIRMGFFVPTVCKADTEHKMIAFTFDDGPTEFTQKTVDVLTKYGAKGSFFCVGQQVEKYPGLVKNMYSEGHDIGNHSYSHPNQMGFLSTEKVYHEIKKCEEILRNVLGGSPRFYRPPFGVTNPNIAKALSKTNYKVIGWNIRSLDTVIRNEKKLYDRIYYKIKPGSIILMHDTSQKSVNVLEKILAQLQKEGYIFVTLNQLLK